MALSSLTGEHASCRGLARAGLDDGRLAHVADNSVLSDPEPLTPRPPARPVVLVAADRSHRAVLGNLGQLHRHDLSEAYGHLPNLDGTFNNRRLDLFLAGADPLCRAWLIMAAGSLCGFIMTAPAQDSGQVISDLFIVRALRRTGVGREAARQVIAMFPGRWSIAFQSYNPGARQFWSRVAADAAGDSWDVRDEPSPAGRPADTWITFQA